MCIYVVVAPRDGIVYIYYIYSLYTIYIVYAGKSEVRGDRSVVVIDKKKEEVVTKSFL